MFEEDVARDCDFNVLNFLVPVEICSCVAGRHSITTEKHRKTQFCEVSVKTTLDILHTIKFNIFQLGIMSHTIQQCVTKISVEEINFLNYAESG